MRIPFISLSPAARLRSAAAPTATSAWGLVTAAAIGVTARYGSPYYGTSYGYGSGYGSPYGYGPYGYGSSYYGWNGDYYYPGSGYYVYDSYRRPYAHDDDPAPILVEQVAGAAGPIERTERRRPTPTTDGSKPNMAAVSQTGAEERRSTERSRVAREQRRTTGATTIKRRAAGRGGGSGRSR